MHHFAPARRTLTILFALITGAITAQTDHAVSITDSRKPRPSLELGSGIISYFGDVGNLGGTAQYSQLNWGYNLTMRSPISNAFSMDVSALFGKVQHQENIPGRLVNFQSPVRMGAVGINYNFNHILPRERTITPYIGVGFGTMEFNPKTDMHDADGNPYHFWSNGSIMNGSEKDGNTTELKPLYRDYNYETDWRELQGGHDAFPLRTLLIPITAGANIAVNDKWNVRLGLNYLYTFSDNFDGINPNTPGVIGANRRKDALLYSSVGIAYNLHHTSKPPKQTNDWSEFELDNDDFDSDGVADWFDLCPNTPKGVAVDNNGCPVDGDRDGVADHLDKELNTATGAIVSTEGVALTDADFERMYRLYIDPGANLQYDKSQTYTADVNKLRMGNRESRGYRIEVLDSENLDGEEIARLLSIPDLKAMEQGDGMLFFIDGIKTKYEAVQRFMNLTSKGVEARILMLDAGEYFELSKSEMEHAAIFGEFEDNQTVVFRVQLGAFRYPLSRNVFAQVPQVLVIPGNDGLTRYVSGSFTTMQAAAKHRVDMLLKGYEGAFVTAYRGGKRITLQEAGATVERKEDLSPKPSGGISPALVKYTVQLGSFTGRVPAEVLGKYMGLGNVRPVRSAEGVTTYVYGSFENEADAQKALENVHSRGFSEATMAGEFNGNIIDASEARRLKSGE